MLNGTTRTGIKKGSRLSAYPVFILLCLYLVGTVQMESFHSLLHADEQDTLHSYINELDPCHRSIYHAKDGGGCAHKTHISHKHQCSLCAAIFHADHLLPEADAGSFLAFHSSRNVHDKPLKASIVTALTSLRGPPVF
jgi:hypothetical protein